MDLPTPDRLPFLPLELALNRAISLDPDAQRELERFEGKRISVDIRGLGLTVGLTVQGAAFQLDSDRMRPAAAIVSAAPLALLRALFGDDEGVTIDGDGGLVLRLRQWLRRWELDVEEPLSRWIGDSGARSLGRGWEAIGEQLSRLHLSRGQDLAEYLTEETRLLPPRPLVELFLDETDRLRADCDRLEARLRRLEERTKTPRE